MHLYIALGIALALATMYLKRRSPGMQDFIDELFFTNWPGFFFERYQQKFGQELSEEQLRKLTFGALLMSYGNEELIGIVPLFTSKKYRTSLKEWWGITNTTEAKYQIQQLLNRTTSSEFDGLLHLYDQRLTEIEQQVARLLDTDLNTVQSVQSTYAWDLARAVSLSKLTFWAGYITRQELWNYIEEATEQASELGQNWQEYTISFLIGRVLHGFDIEPIGPYCRNLYHSENSESLRIPDIDVYQRYPFKNRY